MKAVFLAAVAALALASGAAQASTVLWYNGDFDDANALANELNTIVSDARIYDDFVVTDAAGWTVDSIWSNNLMSFTGVTQADWTIRSGVSVGNGGTVVASGTSAATQVATGRSGFGLTEYMIEIVGLNINLTAGTYWLQVTPIGLGSARSFNSTTSGANGVGTPLGNDGNSFFNSTFFGSNFDSAATFLGSARPWDFSMGVAGAVNGTIPEPGSAALLGLSLIAFVAARRRRK